MIQMMGDKKKALTAILGPESPGIGEVGPPPDDVKDSKHAMAKELMDCISSGDHAGVADALSAFHSYCSGGITEGE